MSARNAKYQKKIADACQPHVDDPIEVVGLFQPKGTLGAFATGYFVNPLTGGMMGRDAQDNAGGVPKIGLYALTANALHVLEGKARGTGWKVKRYVGSWPRDSFRAQPVDGRLTDQVTLTFDDGESITLESMRLGSQGFNEDIIRHLMGADV